MDSLPLHHTKIHHWRVFINRSHTLIHSLALIALIYYRISSFTSQKNTSQDQNIVPFFPWLAVLLAELILSFLWLLASAYGWKPVSRTALQERLPPDSELPAIDVFICTADHRKEPPIEVMNTVLSAMALDYPPNKIFVYVSDDGGSSLTLLATREAWRFAKLWIPFCKKFKVKNRCPKAYFSQEDDHDDDDVDHGGCWVEFMDEREKIETEYRRFEMSLRVAQQEYEDTKDGHHLANSQNHPPFVEIIGYGNGGHDNSKDFGKHHEVPFLIYVAREKRQSSPHHFKAGALNVLLRVSGIISNSAYILGLDCDMLCNDPASARKAMCFHLDQEISPSLAFVQFPQKFHNISKNDIYDAAIRSVYIVKWPGMNGLRGPMLSGTCYYMKRKAFYICDTGKEMPLHMDFTQLRQSFGTSTEFLNTLTREGQIYSSIGSRPLMQKLINEANILASCAYEENTKWGKQIGFFYNTVVEDYFTGFILHCRGWRSVFLDPPTPAFLGCATTNLNDTLVQGTRWNSGLIGVSLSRFCPLIFGLHKMPLLDCMCYAYLSAQPLFCFSAWSLGSLPQLCLFNGIPLYPKVSSPWFAVFAFVFFSPLFKYLWDVLITGGTIKSWVNEWRVWMIKSVTCYFYGTLDALMKVVGVRKASFIPTNKVIDDEQFMRYQLGIYDFQASTMLVAPLVSLVFLNAVSFFWGIAKLVNTGGWEDMFGQLFLSSFILLWNYPIIEGMILRKDKGKIPLSVTLKSIAFSTAFLLFGSVILRSMRY